MADVCAAAYGRDDDEACIAAGSISFLSSLHEDATILDLTLRPQECLQRTKGISATDLRASKTKNCVVKVRLDDTTIRKADLKNARCKIEFDPPYSLESGSALMVELVQSSRLPTSRRVLTAIEFTVTVAKGILETQKVSQLTDHVFADPSAEFRISFSMCFKEPTATVNILSAGVARAAELQSVLDHLGKYSKFLQTFLALGLVGRAVFVGVDQIYQVFQVFTLPKCTLADFEETQLLQEQHKCDTDITALLQDMTDVLACITDVEQFAKSAQLKQAMEEVNPIVRATGNFITKYIWNEYSNDGDTAQIPVGQHHARPATAES
ncbi:hypothetical protein B0H14DRAFT_2637708 [Mycena olivaceomarginata]|nr:hypothetical protein B0H14DRAFT_2637708 [Mycena olivaceomarginata]